jgi:hypothetical protein
MIKKIVILFGIDQMITLCFQLQDSGLGQGLVVGCGLHDA